MVKLSRLHYKSSCSKRDQSDLNRYQHALETLLRAEKEAVAMIEEVKTGLADHTAKGALLKKDPAVATAEDKDKDKDKDKGKQRQVSEDPPEAVGSDDRDLPHSPAADEHGKKKRGALQHRLRECRLTLHKAKFLQGDIYHILGVSQSEDEACGAAEKNWTRSP